MPSKSTPHIIIFPFMAQGHTVPLLDLSKALSNHNIKVTIVTTPSNAKSISAHVALHPHIHITQIPFPTIEALPKGCENTSQLPSMELFVTFIKATKQLKKPFETLLKTMVLESKTRPLCVISDFFLGWTLESCQALNVPRLVFHGMGVLSMVISKYVFVHAPHLKSNSSSKPLEIPGLKLPFTLTINDAPEESVNAQNPDDEFTQFLAEVGEAEAKSWGIVVNSFQELEKNYIKSFESFYTNGAKAWCLGPLCLYDEVKCLQKPGNGNESLDSNYQLLQWLDLKTLGSVIFVSFGTQADVSDKQLDEVAFGLEESGIPYLWVVRSKTWSAPSHSKDKTKSKNGLIVKEWVDQRQILGHPAVGGFLSHCGWNSVLESMSAEVPMLAWPMIAEQSLNAKFVVDGLGAGLGLKRVRSSSGSGSVSREAITEGVRELMNGEKGKTARERAEAIGKAGRRAVQKDGSSQVALSNLISQLCDS